MNTEQFKKSEVLILGGGPAGLSLGYYAQQLGLDFALIEAGSDLGGNCRTLRLGDFLFDTGAHRVHDKDPDITSDIKDLLGDDLCKVSAPSEIYSKGNFFRFPLQLRDLVARLDFTTLLKIVSENMHLKNRKSDGNFGTFAIGQYGETLANLFLLNYSRKLWGVNPYGLSTEVSGGRMKGLDLANFLRETLLGKSIRSDHLDGSFLYPKYGIGMVIDKMCGSIDSERILTNSRVNRLLHDEGRIKRVVLNSGEEFGISTLVNTLPLTQTIKILDPPPPSELMVLADSIKYRNLVLCVFGLDRCSFSPNASLYFPDEEFPFTRIYEPKNRSCHMAPEGKTAIVVECPCFESDQLWSMDRETIRELVWRALQNVQDIDEEEIVCFETFKLPFAYPVLEVDFSKNVEKLMNYLQSFSNLYLTGRSALFRYTHLHDLMRAGRELARELNSVGR